MKLRAKVTSWLRQKAQTFLSIDSIAGAWQTIFEWKPFAWQQELTPTQTNRITSNWAVFACVTLIASDVAKMYGKVVRFSRDLKIWEPTDLRFKLIAAPNRYQTWPEFVMSWVFSLLLWGNTYVLKQRNGEGHVDALYVLDPCRVTPLVAEDGGIYYRLSDDNMAPLDPVALAEGQVVVPASEMIHDRMYALFHPLIGISPIYACGLAARQGTSIQANMEKLFTNMSRPSGILTAPGHIRNDTATRIKDRWQTNYGGDNYGKVAVLGDDLKYQPIVVNPADAQVIEQLKFSGEMICACFHVPPYKLGLGQMPTVNNVAALNQQYLDQCLQIIVEKMERRLDVGLELPSDHAFWLDETALLRMDPQTRGLANSEAIKGNWKQINEVRRGEDLPPVEGGDSIWMQQQNYSLSALVKRDAQEDPFGTTKPATPPATPTEPTTADDVEKRNADSRRRSLDELRVELAA